MNKRINNMNSEFISCLTVLWCSVTYWLGGQELPLIGRGYKWIRRFGLPIGLFIGLCILGAVWWKAAIACTLLSAALHIGYQNRVWKYTASAICMAGPSLILGWHWTLVLPITYHTAYGAISLRDNKFRWVYVGLLMGIGIGICYVSALPTR